MGGGNGCKSAAKREKNFPADAVPIYQRQIDPLLDRKNNGSYEEAVQLLGRIRDLMARLKQSDRFAAYLTTVRAAHKAKRNFIKLAERL